MAHPKHEEIREQFAHCCGYCGVSEVDAAGELTVDHYRPVNAGGDETADNLVYCCARCNLYKGDFWPTLDDAAHGRRVLHPRVDDLTAHCRLNEGTGEVEPLTDTGRFHVELLRLNRSALIAHRLQQRLTLLLAESQQLLEAENSQLRATIQAQAEYLRRLRRALGMEPQ